jgi:hypothetical protein
MKLFSTNLSNTNRTGLWLAYIVFFACILPIAIFAYKRPACNWDMLAYMALVVKMNNSDLNEVHNITYSSARQNIPSDKYQQLVEGNLRSERATNPSEFNNVLPFYAVKPLYIWASFIFYKAGFSLPMSTVLPSIISYLVVGLLLFHWLTKHHNLFFAFLAALLIMFSSVMIAVAGLSTPDFISALLVFTAFYFILEQPSILLAFLFLAGSVLARLDNIIVCLLVLSFLYFIKMPKRISIAQLVSMSVVLLGIYILVAAMTREYGWDMLYYSSFTKYYDPEHQAHPSFSISSYLELFYQRTIMAIVHSHFWLFLLLVLIMIKPFFLQKIRSLPFELLFCILLVFTIILRFVLYPNLEDRFYIAYYLVILIIFMKRY